MDENPIRIGELFFFKGLDQLLFQGEAKGIVIGGVFGFWIDTDRFAADGLHLLDQGDDFGKGWNLKGSVEHLWPVGLRHDCPQSLDLGECEV